MSLQQLRLLMIIAWTALDMDMFIARTKISVLLHASTLLNLKAKDKSYPLSARMNQLQFPLSWVVAPNHLTTRIAQILKWSRNVNTLLMVRKQMVYKKLNLKWWDILWLLKQTKHATSQLKTQLSHFTAKTHSWWDLKLTSHSSNRMMPPLISRYS